MVPSAINVHETTVTRRIMPFLLAAVAVLALGACQTTAREAPAVATGPSDALRTVDPSFFRLSERAIQEGRYEDARAILERVFVVDPENPKAGLLLAELQLAIGSRALAARAFEPLINYPELAPRAHQGKGIVLLLDGDSRSALTELRAAVSQDPTLWRAWNALGYYYDSQGDWDLSEESYANALAINSASAMVHNNRGYSRLMRRDLDGALEEFARAINLDPTFGIARHNLRLALAWKGHYARATLGASDEEMGRIFNNVGFVALMRGDYVAAEKFFVRAMENDASFNDTAWRNLSYIKELRTLGRDDGSVGTAD